MHIMTERGWQPLDCWTTTRVIEIVDGRQIDRGYSEEPLGCFKSQSLALTRDQLSPRCHRFCVAMRKGEFGSFNEPLFGAFGERL
jgi:hypothetical protein